MADSDKTDTDTRPLTQSEKALIRATENTAWNPGLRHALATSLMNRGFTVPPHAKCGDLVGYLEAVTRA